MSTSFYVYETQHNPNEVQTMPRKCKYCGNGMDEGYLHEDSDSTYCAEWCAWGDWEVDGFVNALETGEVFWTTWYDEVEESE